MTPVPNSSSPAIQAMGTAPERSDGSRAVGWVLACMLALLPVAGMPTELVLQDTLKSAILSAGTLIGVWTWWWVQRDKPHLTVHWHGILLLPLVLMAYALGSMWWSHTYLAGVEAARWAMLGLLLWLGLQVMQPNTWMRLVWGIHWGAVGASVWVAAQFWGNLEWFPQAAAPASTFANRNFFAEYAVCALPFSVLAFTQTRSPLWRQPMALVVAFNTVALMMTGTRSALTALLVIAPVLCVGLWRYRHQLAARQWNQTSLAAALVVGCIGVLVLGNIRSQHPESLGQSALSRSWLRAASMAEKTVYAEGSFSYRSLMWKGTARMVMAAPWHGVGAGAWEVYIPFYQGPSADEEPDYYAHNEYLQLLAEYGVPVGGGVLAVLLAYLSMATRNTWRLPAEGGPEAALRGIALTSLLALLIVSLAGFPWRLASTGGLFMLSLALLASSDASLKVRDALGYGTTRVSLRVRQVGLVLLVLASAASATIAVQAVRAEMAIVRSIYALTRAQRSASLDPATSEVWRAQGLALLQEGLSINAHYRKIVSIPADQLVSLGEWSGAALVLHSIAESRPHIANVWANLVLAHVELQQADAAMAAWRELKRLQPETARVRALEVLILSRSGQEAQAIDRITQYFDQDVVDSDTTLLAYSLGLRLRQWNLAERALLLRATTWPETAADSFFRLGSVYASAGNGFEQKALAAFRAGLASVPNGEKAGFRAQVPVLFRNQL